MHNIHRLTFESTTVFIWSYNLRKSLTKYLQGGPCLGIPVLSDLNIFSKTMIQPNFDGSNTFGSMKIRSRQG